MVSQKDQLIRDLAELTGVAEEDVAAVLDELGLAEILAELSRQFGADALYAVACTDLRVSIRIGPLLVAG